MAIFTKHPLSASVNGMQIMVTAVTSASAVPIHTAVAGTSSIDEVWLYAYNDDTSNHSLSILWGGTVEPNNVIRTTIPFKAGRILCVDGMLLNNGLTVKAYADVSGSVVIDGFVNNIA